MFYIHFYLPFFQPINLPVFTYISNIYFCFVFFSIYLVNFPAIYLSIWLCCFLSTKSMYLLRIYSTLRLPSSIYICINLSFDYRLTFLLLYKNCSFHQLIYLFNLSISVNIFLRIFSLLCLVSHSPIYVSIFVLIYLSIN